MMHGTFREPQNSPYGGPPHLSSPGRAAREAAVAVASAAFQVAEDVARRSLSGDPNHPYPTLQMDMLGRSSAEPPRDRDPRDSYGYGSVRGTYGSNSPQRYSGAGGSGYSPRPRSPRASSPRGGGRGSTSRSARPPIPEYAGFESPSSELAAMEREAMEIEYRKIEMEGRIREKRREMEMRSQGGRRGGGGGRPEPSSTHSSGGYESSRANARDSVLEREVSEERRRTKRLTEQLALRESEYRQLERKIHSRTEQRSGYSSSRSHSPQHSTTSSRSNSRRHRI